jgi:pimeloyl-ACP methyl ester carboxylesterase
MCSKKMSLLCIRAALYLLVLIFSDSHSQPDKLWKKESIEIEGKQYVLEKGEIEVPEDRTKANSRTLRLPIQIIRSSNPKGYEPIFWLDGGPGASNILSTDKIAATSPSKLLANHDFVCVGYRGVDGSTVLTSKKINKALKGLDHRMLSDRSLDNIEASIKTYCAQLKKEGIDINRYTIIDVVDDIEQARKTLGYSAINLLSASYGTRVALLYSYRYPKTLKRTVMIGACPPGYFLTRSEQAEKIIYCYDSLYQAQTGAKVSIAESMKQAFANLPTRWSTFKLDADKIKAGTVGALYNCGFAVFAFNCYFKAAQKKDYSGLYMLQKIYEMNTNSVIGDVFAKTVSADIENNVDYRQMRDSLRQSNTLLGNNISVIYGSTAHVWSIQSIPEEYKITRNSNAETLVISGDLDFRTPAYITNRELMPFLTNGKHIVLKNMSHTDILLNVMKSQEFLFQYFDYNNVDQSLIKSIERIDFKASGSISKVKIFVAGLLF